VGLDYTVIDSEAARLEITVGPALKRKLRLLEAQVLEMQNASGDDNQGSGSAEEGD